MGTSVSGSNRQWRVVAKWTAVISWLPLQWSHQSNTGCTASNTLGALCICFSFLHSEKSFTVAQCFMTSSLQLGDPLNWNYQIKLSSNQGDTRLSHIKRKQTITFICKQKKEVRKKQNQGGGNERLINRETLRWQNRKLCGTPGEWKRVLGAKWCQSKEKEEEEEEWMWT